MSEKNLGSNSRIDEEAFLSSYSVENYDRPSVTTDIVAFKVRSEIGDTYRHNSKSKLSILMVKRGEHPYKGMWALPGGFLRRDETVEECAYREIMEESNVSPISLMPVGIFSNPNRDPRGRIISNAFLSIICDEVKPKAGTDAVEARWFDISFKEVEGEFQLVLTSDEISLSARLVKMKTIFKKTDFEIIETGDLAFDHASIIGTAITLLRYSSKDFDLIFDFLPETFTLTTLQDVVETIMNVALTPANFRRKISEYVEETEEYVTGAGHRPAKLYKRK